MKNKRVAIILAMVTLLTICVQPIVVFAVPASTLTSSSQSVLTVMPLADTVLSNSKAKVDVTNTSSGYVNVAYTGGGTARIKVLLTGPKGTTYQYNLNNSGTYETLPLSEGDGKYDIKVCVNTGGSKYSIAYSTEFTVKLKDQFAPFLVSNQYVNYTSKSKAVEQAATLTKGMTDDIQKLETIYSYVIGTLTYDKDRAAKVIKGELAGYLPDIDSVLAAKKGICFDYAALMSAMLRSQGIPCKLVVGLSKDQNHAWISAYLKSVGWVDSVIYFDGKDWKLMDPTYASSLKSSEKLLEVIGDGKSYTAKFYY